MAGSGREAAVEVVLGCEPGMDGGVMTNELGGEWLGGWGQAPCSTSCLCLGVVSCSG